MKLDRINFLRRLNRSFLFVFFILFTVPLEADDFITEGFDNDRRRSSILLIETQSNTPDSEMASQQLPLSPKSTVVLTKTADIPYDKSQFESNFENVAPDQGQFALRNRSHATGALAELPQKSNLESIARELELKSMYSQWMGTAVSETGPPSLDDIVNSFLPGNEFFIARPRVIKAPIPNQYQKQVSHEIDQKILSVRTPTGPPNFARATISPQDFLNGPGYIFLKPSVTPIHKCTLRASRDIPRGDAMRPSMGSG